VDEIVRSSGDHIAEKAGRQGAEDTKATLTTETCTRGSNG